jgi:Ser/Thr protein kinase RdoA (MazF antagonist)
MSFETLTPDAIIDAVEAAAGLSMTGLTIALPSYINRVYELRAKDGAKLIAKFYRPGRWSREAILDEHRFTLDCTEAELPVVAPLTLANRETLAEHGGILFALFPKKAGRQLEINDESDWPRLGSLIGRLHVCGEKRAAQNRVVIAPGLSATGDVEYLCGRVIPQRFRDGFRAAATSIIQRSTPAFEGLPRIRLHGDCHRGNILDRLDEGLLLIDFDDMAMGPAVQDLWLLLPDRVSACGREIELFLRGYGQFREFDRSTLRCVEPLRAMRMIYFLAWASRQEKDALFRRNFPEWGTDAFWQREINDLREQLGFVEDAIFDMEG